MGTHENAGAELDAVLADLATQGSENADDIDALAVRVAALEAGGGGNGGGGEPAPSAGTLYGACLTNGGNEAAVLTKFGQGAAIRRFYQETLTWPSVPSGCPAIHISYKPSQSQVLAGTLNGQIDQLLERADDSGKIVYLTFWHESDNDGLSSAGITDRVRASNHVYDRVEAWGNPRIQYGPIHTGGFFADYTGDSKRAPWSGMKGHFLGADMDGVHDGKTYDISYADETARVVALVSEWGYEYWTVPEFGTSRRPDDPTGEPRADWFEQWAGHFAEHGAAQVLLYDYDTSANDDHPAGPYNVVVDGSPELAVWRGLVATNA
jgi:hypothetical protein